MDRRSQQDIKDPNPLNVFFSIIIPTHNSIESLPNAIKSILDQAFKDYEIIIIDSLSTDGTIELINHFKNSKNCQIIGLSESDDGIYDAMNKGISLSSGEWCYFMGSDDQLNSKNVLKDIYLKITNQSCDLIYGNVVAGKSQIKYVYNSFSKVLSQGIHHQSIFYRKSLFDELGKYDLSFKVAADYYFTLKVLLKDKYKKRYVDIDIANYGETGFSSVNYDYSFYSYHYRMLAQNNAIDKIDDPQGCLQKSIYCCLYLARTKTNVSFASANLFFYLTREKTLTTSFRIKTALAMLRWNMRLISRK
jgi:glycosyltransferase involved in cell wall biosynthesis